MRGSVRSERIPGFLGVGQLRRGRELTASGARPGAIPLAKVETMAAPSTAAPSCPGCRCRGSTGTQALSRVISRVADRDRTSTKGPESLVRRWRDCVSRDLPHALALPRIYPSTTALTPADAGCRRLAGLTRAYAESFRLTAHATLRTHDDVIADWRRSGSAARRATIVVVHHTTDSVVEALGNPLPAPRLRAGTATEADRPWRPITVKPAGPVSAAWVNRVTRPPRRRTTGTGCCDKRRPAPARRLFPSVPIRRARIVGRGNHNLPGPDSPSPEKLSGRASGIHIRPLPRH